MTWVEMLDSVYVGWFGRWSLTLFVLGIVLMLLGGLIGAVEDPRDDHGFWPFTLGALMLVLVLGAGAVWVVTRLLTWAVTGL